jgi:hypothetical protein
MYTNAIRKVLSAVRNSEDLQWWANKAAKLDYKLLCFNGTIYFVMQKRKFVRIDQETNTNIVDTTGVYYDTSLHIQDFEVKNVQ